MITSANLLLRLLVGNRILETFGDKSNGPVLYWQCSYAGYNFLVQSST